MLSSAGLTGAKVKLQTATLLQIRDQSKIKNASRISYSIIYLLFMEDQPQNMIDLLLTKYQGLLVAS